MQDNAEFISLLTKTFSDVCVKFCRQTVL